VPEQVRRIHRGVLDGSCKKSAIIIGLVFFARAERRLVLEVAEPCRSALPQRRDVFAMPWPPSVLDLVEVVGTDPL
jgi:hypothetical protein